MDAEFILMIAIIAIPAVFFTIKAVSSRNQEMTGPATVLSHRVAHRSEMPRQDARWVGGWNYLVTFTFSDGDELELYTLQPDYQALQDGTHGQLTWQGKRFIDFESDN